MNKKDIPKGTWETFIAIDRLLDMLLYMKVLSDNAYNDTRVRSKEYIFPHLKLANKQRKNER